MKSKVERVYTKKEEDNRIGEVGRWDIWELKKKLKKALNVKLIGCHRWNKKRETYLRRSRGFDGNWGRFLSWCGGM